MTTTQPRPSHGINVEPHESQTRWGRWAVTEVDSDETLIALYVIDPDNNRERYPYVLLTPGQVRELIADLVDELVGMTVNCTRRPIYRRDGSEIDIAALVDKLDD
jgi:hypothetical protein